MGYSLQTSRYNKSRLFPYLAVGGLTIILIYVLSGHAFTWASIAELHVPHNDPPREDSGHLVAEIELAKNEQEDGWYTTPEMNKYGKEGVDVSEYLSPEQIAASNENLNIEHVELRSQMTKDGKWFTVDFVTQDAYNPGFLPHLYKQNVWVMFGQRDKNQMGPHDARVFHGPNAPYIIYGSQGPRSCLGQYIHDLRRLTPSMWNQSQRSMTSLENPFFWATDLQRPKPFGLIEKNWSAFWDMNDEMFLHYDVKSTGRSFAKVRHDGSVGEDIAPLAATSDEKCMKELMPPFNDNGLEAIHQATNSLSITLCNRSDPDCHQRDDNTFIMLIFQKKSAYMHTNYYPYAMLFRRTPPFEVFGISNKPFWYSGRGKANEFWRWTTWKPKDQTQSVYTMQMSWFDARQTYHGYLDDKIILAFGIEDKHAGGIDVMAGSLLEGMRFCSDVDQDKYSP